MAGGRKRSPGEKRGRKKRDDHAYVFFDTEGKDVGAPLYHIDTTIDLPGGKTKRVRRPVYRHRLIYGAAVDENGNVLVEVEGGLDSQGEPRQPPPEVWLEALLEAGRVGRCKTLFAYGFGYDRTKMLEGLPAEILFMLTRREARPVGEAWVHSDDARGKGGRDAGGKKKSKTPGKPKPKPLYWKQYRLDLMGTLLTISRLRRDALGVVERDGRGRAVRDTVSVADLIKFYQCPFTEALDAWRKKEAKGENLDSRLEIPDAELDRMRLMKSQRDRFNELPWEEVKDYCKGECRNGARLARELVRACDGIGIELRRFDGAGSISDALLRKHEVNLYMSTENVTCRYVRDSVLRRKMGRAVMGAFFGGRFESAWAGVVERPVYPKDICSAYPYAMSQLPCLACGKWEHIEDANERRRGRGLHRRIEEATLALVRVRSHGWALDDRRGGQAYGSLPHRDKEGNITFPIQNAGVWVWRPEYLAARDAMRDRLEVDEAYLYHTDCDHKPFAFMPALYVERLRIGKEGRGIAMKLGYNGCAGKTMQRVGSPRWQDYVFAGMTTSTTRGQLAESIALFGSPWDVCYLATDSVFATDDVELPEPAPTGTGEAAQLAAGVPAGKTKPPLGAWERGDTYDKGMCFVRPGIAFPLDITADQAKAIKARGISKKVLLDESARVIEHMRSQKSLATAEDEGSLRFERRLFGGMKMCVSRGHAPGARNASADGWRYTTARKRYGLWYEQPMVLSVDAQPKRLARLDDGTLLPWPDCESGSVDVRGKPCGPRGPSVAYGDAKKSQEAIELEMLQDMLLEQPDGGDCDGPDESAGWEG